jgi:hypothetical protein
LEFGTDEERKMKVKLLKDVIKIAAPLEPVEAYLHHKRSAVSGASLKDWLDKRKRYQSSVLDEIKEKQRLAVVNSQFVKVLDPENWKEFVNQLEQPKKGQTNVKPVIVVPKVKKDGRVSKYHRSRENEPPDRPRRIRSPSRCICEGDLDEEQSKTQAEVARTDE